MNARVLVCAALGVATGFLTNAYAEQPPPPCHPNPNAAADRDAVAARGDIAKLPQALKDRLIRLLRPPPTRNAAADREAVSARGDIAKLPQALKDRLIRLADRPNPNLPLQVFSEAD